MFVPVLNIIEKKLLVIGGIEFNPSSMTQIFNFAKKFGYAREFQEVLIPELLEKLFSLYLQRKDFIGIINSNIMVCARTIDDMISTNIAQDLLKLLRERLESFLSAPDAYPILHDIELINDLTDSIDDRNDFDLSTNSIRPSICKYFKYIANLYRPDDEQFKLVMDSNLSCDFLTYLLTSDEVPLKPILDHDASGYLLARVKEFLYTIKHYYEQNEAILRKVEEITLKLGLTTAEIDETQVFAEDINSDEAAASGKACKLESQTCEDGTLEHKMSEDEVTHQDPLLGEIANVSLDG